MNERHLSTPARRRRSRRLHSLSCSALAACMLCTSLPLYAQGTRAAKAQAANSRAPVTLNFVNADIEAVTRAMSAMLDRPIIVDPRVRGNITVYSEQPLTIREAYLNYLAALRGLGFTVVENAGLLKVVPEADAKLQAGTVQVGAPNLRGDQIVTQVFRLNYENANNLVTVLRPLISPNNTINANPGNNTLVITDYADNLQRISRIIAALDTPTSTDVEVIPLQHAVASDLAPLVQRLAEGGSGVSNAPNVPGVASLGSASVIADPHSNALIVRAGNPARLASLRGIIDKLDRPNGAGGPAGNIYVVYLRNADATKLATVLRAAFSAGGSSAGGGNAGGGGFGGGSTPSATMATNSNVGGNNTGTGTGASSAAATAPLAASAQPSTGGFVQADPATNSLIITAPEPLYKQVRAVIDQLDSRRAQVYVEALICEVDADKAAELGIQWQAISGAKGDTNILGLGTNFGSGLNNILSASQVLAQGTTGLAGVSSDQVSALNGVNFAVAHKVGSIYTLGALARALQSTTGANILSTPNLVTLDNEEAKIVVGQNVPFVTGSFTNTGTGTGATNPFQTIERQDVGLVLRIRPQIGEGDTVRMTIFQESSAIVAPAAGTANAGPSTSKRSIESTVVVNDGQILVLGGLIEDNYSETKDKVPLLGDIPLVGGLFRSESRSRRKTNLMVFLRPVVMRSAQAANDITMSRYDMIRGLQTDAQPQSRIFMHVNEAGQLPAVPPLPAASAANPASPASAPVAEPLVQPPAPSASSPNAPKQ